MGKKPPFDTTSRVVARLTLHQQQEQISRVSRPPYRRRMNLPYSPLAPINLGGRMVRISSACSSLLHTSSADAGWCVDNGDGTHDDPKTSQTQKHCTCTWNPRPSRQIISDLGLRGCTPTAMYVRTPLVWFSPGIVPPRHKSRDTGHENLEERRPARDTRYHAYMLSTRLQQKPVVRRSGDQEERVLRRTC